MEETTNAQFRFVASESAAGLDSQVRELFDKGYVLHGTVGYSGSEYYCALVLLGMVPAMGVPYGMMRGIRQANGPTITSAPRNQLNSIKAVTGQAEINKILNRCLIDDEFLAKVKKLADEKPRVKDDADDAGLSVPSAIADGLT